MEGTLFLSIFVIGLSYGATACMFSCMPFLNPLLVTHSNSTKEALEVIVPFSMERVFSYTLIALVAYMSSVWVKELLNNSMVFSTVLGVLTLLLGGYLFYKSYASNEKCHGVPRSDERRVGTVGLFAIGATMAINPCVPVMTLLALAANSNSAATSLGLGVSFGLGAVAFSILFYGFIVSKMIKGIMAQFALYKKHIERLAALMLMVVGVLVLNGKVVL